MKKRWMIPALLAAVLALTAILVTGCANGGNGSIKDGYYTAEMSEFSRGWKEYVTICVNGGSIASVEYNALNASGFIKAWDMAYMRDMGSVSGMYPNRYTREYAWQLMENQSAVGIDTVSGATSSGVYFRLLADAVIRQAMVGDDDVAIVEMPKESSQTATALPVAAAAVTPVATPTSTPTAMPTTPPTATPTPAPASTATAIPTTTPAPTPASTPTAMPTTAQTATPAPTTAATTTAMPTTAPTVTPAPTPAMTPTAMSTTTPTATSAPKTIATPTAMPTTTPTARPVPTAAATPTAKPASTTAAVVATPAATPAIKPAVTSAATRPGVDAGAVSSATVKGA